MITDDGPKPVTIGRTFWIEHGTMLIYTFDNGKEGIIEYEKRRNKRRKMGKKKGRNRGERGNMLAFACMTSLMFYRE